MVNRIVIDPMRRAEGQSAVRAPREHHVSPGTETSWLYTGDHVNIIVSGTAGAVYCQERLPYQAAWIGPPRVAEIETAAKADLSDLVKSGRDCRVLRIAGAKAPKWAGKVGRAADKEIAVCIHVQRSPDRRVRKKDWIHPCGPAIGGAAELPTTPIVARGAPSLIQEPVTCAVGRVYGEPFLVTSAHITKCCTRPRTATVCRAPYIVKKCLAKAEVEKCSCVIRVQYRVAAKNVIFQDARERPRDAGIGGEAPAALPEVRVNSVKLPPADRHFIAICRIHCDRRFVCGVPEDIVPLRVDVDLVTREYAQLRDHPRRTLQPISTRWCRRHPVFFEWLGLERLARGRLSRSGGKRGQEGETNQKACG